uniref:Oogenesis-related gene n=1 Tax=Acanthochromis polyacanthus TaxID=80966 RepID=A0A3Q1F4A7_9TELE
MSSQKRCLSLASGCLGVEEDGDEALLKEAGETSLFTDLSLVCESVESLDSFFLTPDRWESFSLMSSVFVLGALRGVSSSLFKRHSPAWQRSASSLTIWGLWLKVTKPYVVVTPVVQSPSRHSLTGRKRLRRITRLLLSILPWCVQGFLGYPVASRIGLSLSPEIRGSPTKPCGKGSKRKQDELDEDEDEEEQPTWVEALSQDLADDEGPDVDPDFEPSTIETDTEEYNLHNDTESDFEVPGKGIVIEDVKTVRSLLLVN